MVNTKNFIEFPSLSFCFIEQREMHVHDVLISLLQTFYVFYMFTLIRDISLFFLSTFSLTAIDTYPALFLSVLLLLISIGN